MANNSSFIAPLTSLRFFAAMGAVLYHSGAYRIQESGYLGPIANLLVNGRLGVTFFFVLSGFILQKTYSGRFERTSAKKRYLWARVARILPVYLLALSLTALFVDRVRWQSLPQFLMLQHWIPWRVFPLDNWNYPAWSLSVELFFYLLFPSLSRSATRFAVLTLLRVGVALALIMLILQTPEASIGPTMPMQWMLRTPLPLIRLPEFLLGIALGELSLRGVPRLPGISAGIIAIVIVLVLCVSTGYFIAPIAAILAAAMIFQTADEEKTWFARALAWPPLVLLGGASYSIYLFAFPTRMAFTQLGLTSVTALLCYPIVLVGVGILVFKFVEEPCRGWLRSARLDAPAVDNQGGVPRLPDPGD